MLTKYHDQFRTFIVFTLKRQVTEPPCIGYDRIVLNLTAVHPSVKHYNVIISAADYAACISVFERMITEICMTYCAHLHCRLAHFKYSPSVFINIMRNYYLRFRVHVWIRPITSDWLRLPGNICSTVCRKGLLLGPYGLGRSVVLSVQKFM